jgi:hypothetical protein
LVLRQRVTRDYSRLYNENLCALYSSSNTIQEIKSRIMRWAVHVESMADRRGTYRVQERRCGERPEGRRRLKDLGKDGIIILKWIFEKSAGQA